MFHHLRDNHPTLYTATWNYMSEVTCYGMESRLKHPSQSPIPDWPVMIPSIHQANIFSPPRVRRRRVPWRGTSLVLFEELWLFLDTQMIFVIFTRCLTMGW